MSKQKLIESIQSFEKLTAYLNMLLADRNSNEVYTVQPGFGPDENHPCYKAFYNGATSTSVFTLSYVEKGVIINTDTTTTYSNSKNYYNQINIHKFSRVLTLESDVITCLLDWAEIDCVGL